MNIHPPVWNYIFRCFLKAELESLALLSDAGDPNNYLQINDNINLLIDA